MIKPQGRFKLQPVMLIFREQPLEVRLIPERVLALYEAEKLSGRETYARSSDDARVVARTEP